jgi:uncharacterized membrane protein HdeD (DUF308 family)
MRQAWGLRVQKPRQPTEERRSMITLGVICLILGLVLEVPVLWTIGIILIVVGIILAILGMMDRAIGPRRHYY